MRMSTSSACLISSAHECYFLGSAQYSNLFNETLFLFIYIMCVDVAEGEMVMIYATLSPSRMGSVSFYLPILVSD